ncbi:hypothetical protein FTX61_20350 [Nitriliruptoraceae bacterium ZYF776]|nr:hypothetical protein [Profundirhabdus halotolerans]
MTPARSARLLASTLAISLLAAVPAAAGDDGRPGSTDPATVAVVADPVAATTAPDHATSSTRSAFTDGSCPTPTDPSPAPRFRDTAGSPHTANIDCVARWGIAQGTGDRTYSPRRDVTRGQMATFVANLIRATGIPLPEGRDRFSDDGPPHETNINALANADIIGGTGGGRYQPNRNVTRAQAATILAGAYRHLQSFDLPVGPDRFGDDDGSPHEASINRLANAGVINGLTATRFGHADPLKRDQMASLLARFLPSITEGTLWYADYQVRGTEGRYELVSIRPGSPTERHVVHSAPSSSFHAVDPVRREYAHIDLSFDGPAGEPRNQVYVRSLADDRVRTQFRWGDQCEGRIPNESARQVSAPLPSPDGEWFVAEARYGSPQYLYGVEVRDRAGGCQLSFGHQELQSWAWMSNGDLLVVIDGDALQQVTDAYALAIVPRAQIADGQIQSMTVLAEYPDAPSGIAVSNDQQQIAYTYRDDLHVFDRRTGDDHRVAHSAHSLIHPAFSPDDRSLVVRHRTFGNVIPSNGEVHLVANHRGAATQVRSGGPTELRVPASPGDAPTSFDAKDQFFWAR